jgi:hypothetical protein
MDAQARPGSTRDALLVGFVLVLIGTAAVISELWPDFDRYLPLLVGIGLLAVFVASRSYLALVGGAIVTGLGVGLAVAELFPGGEADGPGAVLGLGVGFISIWLISTLLALKESHWWPLVPGLILTTVGVGMVFDAVSQPLVVPILLVVVGAAIMVVGYLRLTRPRVGGSA